MEGILLHSSQNQSHLRNYKKINNFFISRPAENFYPLNLQTGILQTPHPFLSHSFPPYSVPQQPPFLPGAFNNGNANLPLARGLSCPPNNRKLNNSRSRDSSLTPKKAKNSSISSPKKETTQKTISKMVAKVPSESVFMSSANPTRPDPRNLPKEEMTQKTISKVVAKVPSESVIISSTSPMGPNPRSLPKGVPKMFSSSAGSFSYANGSSIKAAVEDQVVDKFSGSVVFTVSPPPSSLPLPTFSLRPKLSCNAEAAGIDAGATDDLRRLLRLR